jgi:DNA-directed RNA polymerase subunit RPC12/RpoP
VPNSSEIPEPIAKLQCPRCQSRLEVFETTSGGRTVSVATLGPTVEDHPLAQETFHARDEGPRIKCPACGNVFDPAGVSRAIPRRRE